MRLERSFISGWVISRPSRLADLWAIFTSVLVVTVYFSDMTGVVLLKAPQSRLVLRHCMCVCVCVCVCAQGNGRDLAWQTNHSALRCEESAKKDSVHTLQSGSMN